MTKKDQLEPLEDGWVAFHAEGGERWRHKDLAEGRVGEGYRVFVADDGQERRYRFGSGELHDATLEDLREQLRRSEPVTGESGEMPSSPPPVDR